MGHSDNAFFHAVHFRSEDQHLFPDVHNTGKDLLHILTSFCFKIAYSKKVVNGKRKKSHCQVAFLYDNVAFLVSFPTARGREESDRRYCLDL